MADCIFCKILAGKAPASFIYKDENCSAFMDLHPVNPGHVLVVPNEHAASLAQLPPDTGGYLFQVGQRVAAALRESGLRCEGVNFFLADGAAAGQEVFHVHLHVLPRFAGDGFGFRRRPGSGFLTGRASLDETAARIEAEMSQIPPQDAQ